MSIDTTIRAKLDGFDFDGNPRITFIITETERGIKGWTDRQISVDVGPDFQKKLQKLMRVKKCQSDLPARCVGDFVGLRRTCQNRACKGDRFCTKHGGKVKA